jgi:CMP-N-acetylneuraminic acid synthetase
MNICMVPARQGSVRLAKKNYLKIGQFTVLEIALMKAIKSKVFDRIVINTDDPLLEKIAIKMNVDFYLRQKELASSNATSDQVVLDFFNNNNGDQIFWLNTVSPLQTIKDIRNFVEIAQEANWNSGVSINTAHVHAVCDDKSLNFKWESGFARTQDLRAVKYFNYAMMGWNRTMINKLRKGQLFDHNTKLIESSKWSSFLLKNQYDMELIKMLSKIAPDQGLKKEK